jgi:hypothetical protein
MGPRYEALLSQYVDELRAAKSDVNDWWAALVEQTLQLTNHNKVEAARELRRRWPVGPAAHPRILAIVRKYYLACAHLNQVIENEQSDDLHQLVPHRLATSTDEPEQEPDQPVSPGILVGESLITPATDDLAKIVGQLTYWPVGVDEQGAYV